MATTAVPQLPSRYTVLGVLGEGGMGRVYRAHDTQLDRKVAIKVIEKTEVAKDGTERTVAVERFVREARAAARLDHPNIAAVHDVDPEAGWLVMELVEGKPLHELPIPAPPAMVRRIAEQVLSALEAAHGAGVIHRDIKPSNIIVDANLHVTLIDFGIARLLDARFTQTGENLGTPAYMAPEQLRGGVVDERTDLYSLGVMLYELATGERLAAFDAPSADAIARVRLRCADQPGLARVIDHCLRAEPEARFESATMALAALVNASDINLEVAPKAAPSPRRRPRWLLPALAGLLVVACVVAVVGLTRGGGDGGSGDRRPPDPRIAAAFRQAQRGEHERAGQILDDYLGQHPDDPDALSLRVLTAWWDGTTVDDWIKRATAAPLSAAQRAMVRAIELSLAQRLSEAVAFLATAERELPDSPEVVYMIGELQFHAQQVDTGVATLERAFRIDPRWQVALHHVVERKATLGELAPLRSLAELARTVDPAMASVVDCKIAIAERAYTKAAAIARDAIAREDAVAELHVCLAQALTLAGDLAAADAATRRATELWPIDLREWGGMAHHAEQLLYRGKLPEYLATVRNKPSRQRTLVLALWQPSADTGFVADRSTLTPLGGAVAVLAERAAGREPDLARFPDPEVRLFGQGLAAEAHNDRKTAIAKYREALAAPGQGDVEMLLAHRLARVLKANGDAIGAARACEAVLFPRVYRAYRAVLLPECALWSDNATAQKAVAAAWEGATFVHPAVVEIRKRVR